MSQWTHHEMAMSGGAAAYIYLAAEHIYTDRESPAHIRVNDWRLRVKWYGESNCMLIVLLEFDTLHFANHPCYVAGHLTIFHANMLQRHVRIQSNAKGEDPLEKGLEKALAKLGQAVREYEFVPTAQFDPNWPEEGDGLLMHADMPARLIIDMHVQSSLWIHCNHFRNFLVPHMDAKRRESRAEVDRIRRLRHISFDGFSRRLLELWQQQQQQEQEQIEPQTPQQQQQQHQQRQQLLQLALSMSMQQSVAAP